MSSDDDDSPSPQPANVRSHPTALGSSRNASAASAAAASASSKLADLSAPRALPTRAALLRSIESLAPQWRPFSMSAEERRAWYRIRNDNFAGACSTSKEWLLVGRKYEAKHKFEEAAQAYCRALRLNPHCAAYYFRLGCVQCELGEWSGAIESFHIALTLAPETARATYYFNLGFAHSEQRAWMEAIDALKHAIEIKPRKHVYHNLIAVCYRHSGDHDLSIQHYRHAIALDRVQPAYRRNLAYVYMQLKKWAKAVRAWTGAISVSPPHMHAELYRNRAFAQAERGYLALACEDMGAALSRYTALQQRRRCEEKLERWTSRLQGTEQAYMRRLADSASFVRDSSDPEEARRRRRRVKQMAGLIQGEWEDWHGEDVDIPTSTDEDEADEMGGLRSEVERVKKLHRKGARALLHARHGPVKRSKLNMEKASRAAPASLTTPSARAAAAQMAAHPPDSSSAHIRRMISELRLDEDLEDKVRAEKRARRADRAARRQAKLERALNNGGGGAQEESKEHAEEEISDDTTSGSSSEDNASGESDNPNDVAEDAERASVAAASSVASSAAAAAAASPSPASSSRPGHGRSSSILSSSDGSAESFPEDPASLAASVSRDATLYAEDGIDPFSSLNKLFIRLRIDAKYLWRFEEAGIHLSSIHTVTPSELRRVLPPIGPRLTLMNCLQERIAWLRERDGLPPLTQEQLEAAAGQGAPTSASSSGQNSARDSSDVAAANAAIAARIVKGAAPPLSARGSFRPAVGNRGSTVFGSPRPMSARGDVRTPSASPHRPPPLQPTSPASVFSPLSSAASPPANAFADAPLSVLSPTPMVPASPHNGVAVHRPLSARDRRTLYDARKHARSAMAPISCYGAVTWK